MFLVQIIRSGAMKLISFCSLTVDLHMHTIVYAVYACAMQW